MREQQRSKRISFGVIAAVFAAVVATSAGVAFFTLHSTKGPVTQNPNPPVEQPQPNPPNTSPSIEKTTNVYLLKDTGKNLELVARAVQVKAASESPKDVLEATFSSLLTTNSTGGDASTTIPTGTKLLGLKVENDGIYVNLSKDFTSGGGAASMSGRLGQVIYTATTLEPNAKVFVEVEGEKLETLGGEGLELEQPLTRESFNKDFPL